MPHMYGCARHFLDLIKSIFPMSLDYDYSLLHRLAHKFHYYARLNVEFTRRHATSYYRPQSSRYRRGLQCRYPRLHIQSEISLYYLELCAT